MASVQFYGSESVLQAADNYACAAWAIFINGKLFTKYEGDDLTASQSMLAQMLDMLQDSNSAGIYTLKFFEQNTAGQKLKITEKSVCDAGSFNFKLTTEQDRENRGLAISGFGSVRRELDELKVQISELKSVLETEVEDPEPQGLGAVAMDLLKDPGKILMLINAGKSLLGLQPTPMPANIAGIDNINFAGQAEDMDLQNMQRVSDAVDVLGEGDPKLADRLEKLAKMKKDNPAAYAQIISLFDMQQ